MRDGYSVVDPAILESLHDPARDFAYDVLAGLSERPKRLDSRYFYDDRGSVLFSRIMELDEYYPTRCETAILTRHAGEIVSEMGERPLNLVDLGAGDGKKTVILLRALREAGLDVRFVPIDISEGAMRTLIDAVRAELPGLTIEGLVSEYVDGVHYLGQDGSARRNLVLFLGSNIGNFNRVGCRRFFRRIWSVLGDDDRFLVGFDLKKDIEVLLAAYNDAGGVTAEFNLNLLARINRELGADFDLSKFRHYGTYNVFSGAMESYLVSLATQTVRVDALQQSFAVSGVGADPHRVQLQVPALGHP